MISGSADSRVCVVALVEPLRLDSKEEATQLRYDYLLNPIFADREGLLKIYNFPRARLLCTEQLFPNHCIREFSSRHSIDTLHFFFVSAT
jgi:hypothetical protein